MWMVPCKRKLSSGSQITMCSGPILPQLCRFSLPLVMTGILQLLFNTADVAVVGRFSGSQALAAVGSTSVLTEFLVGGFTGLSVGVDVVVAKYCGAGNKKALWEVVQTAVLTAIVAGMALALTGILSAPSLLQLMDTPEDVVDASVLYMQIYFLGTPGMMVYNLGSAVLRGIGNPRRPLCCLFAAGVVNVIFNLLFVTGFHMDAAGVALATVISNFLSAGLILAALADLDIEYRLEIKSMRIRTDKLKEIMSIGIPAGIQAVVFSFGNIFVQSAVNSFGSVVMAGNSAASTIGSYVYTAVNGVNQGVLNFTGQNYGARQYRRVNRILWVSLGTVAVLGIGLGGAVYLAGGMLLKIFTRDAKVIDVGLLRLSIFCTFFFVCGMSETICNVLKGMGYAAISMALSVLSGCVLRVTWIYTVFGWFPSLKMLYLNFPVTWGVALAAQVVCYLVIRKRYTVAVASADNDSDIFG